MLYIDRLGQALDDADAARQKTFQELMDRLDGPGKTALAKSETSWEQYRDSEVNLLNKTFDSRYSGNRIESMQFQVDLSQKRADHLVHRLQVLKEQDGDK
jgi:uncharacterized protein YecT (DUF1311 family)